MSASSGHKNRLAAESSPYLHQHESNPVDWYPWGPEALERARAEKKPILLSIGYSACHWCHVMAHESFEDADTAGLMNEHFINVKVDREERADLDQLYQGVVQLMGRGGGWPLTVFLTPELKPFYGGTYFPPAPRHGLPGFANLLMALARAWDSERAEILQQGETFVEGLTQVASFGLEDSGSRALQASDLVDAAQALLRRVDFTHGGFGHGGPKFPNPMNVALLLRGYRRSGEVKLRDAALLTLDKMAEGGIYDQLGGGFHRYSVDGRWLVPHFEKMLYDNAQLLHLYSEGMQLRPTPLYEKAAAETVRWLEREMTSPEGGFYAAQDADSEGEEGRFFVWTHAELENLLGQDAALFCAHFGVSEHGNFEHGKNVLEVVLRPDALAAKFGVSVAEVERRLGAARAKLFEVRAKRVPPGRDDKILAGWNGLMLRGLAAAGRVFQRPAWLALAERAADFLVRTLWSDRKLKRSFQGGSARHEGLLEDYGALSAGLVALYQSTSTPRWLEVARALAAAAQAHFWDEERQAYRSAPKGQADLLVPVYSLHDNAVPSGAASLLEAQVAIAALTEDAELLARAGKYLERMQPAMAQTPMGFGHLWQAADACLDGAAELMLLGGVAEVAPLLESLRLQYLPTLAVHHVGAATASNEVVKARAAKGTAAWLCRGGTCLPPATSAEALREALAPLTVSR